jgi:DNA-binding CsgD family transcriptional regulator
VLTARERDVLRLVAAGYTYKEVGARLSISARTVETHAASVLRKLQLSNRWELSRWAKARPALTRNMSRCLPGKCPRRVPSLGSPDEGSGPRVAQAATGAAFVGRRS